MTSELCSVNGCKWSAQRSVRACLLIETCTVNGRMAEIAACGTHGIQPPNLDFPPICSVERGPFQPYRVALSRWSNIIKLPRSSAPAQSIVIDAVISVQYSIDLDCCGVIAGAAVHPGGSAAAVSPANEPPGGGGLQLRGPSTAANHTPWHAREWAPGARPRGGRTAQASRRAPRTLPPALPRDPAEMIAGEITGQLECTAAAHAFC